MRLAFVPGASVAVIDGSSFDARGFGVTRADGGAPVTADTVFEAASLSKPVFAYLVHSLAAEGKLDLDRPLREYLPLPNPADTGSATITARHVLSHTTGWRNWRFSREQTLTADFAPGSRWSYSGEGYYFLQRVVERVTGRGILRLTRERVFQPLGMRRSAYLWTAPPESSRAEPHSRFGLPLNSYNARTSGRFIEAAASASRSMDDWTHEDAERALSVIDKDAPLLPNFLLPNVAGSLFTTANDYGAFLRHLLGVPGAPAGGRAILDRMTEPQVTLNEALRWGLGVGLETDELRAPPARPLFWHWGDNTGFKSFLLGDPAASSAVVVFTNGDNGRAIYERVVRGVRGADQPAFLAL
jgi:CubicO group peptidase (beta-lactamase class C family)